MQRSIQVSLRHMEAAQAPVELVVDCETTFWTLQHCPLCLGQEICHKV